MDEVLDFDLDNTLHNATPHIFRTSADR